jgi:hypothetical protein
METFTISALAPASILNLMQSLLSSPIHLIQQSEWLLIRVRLQLQGQNQAKGSVQVLVFGFDEKYKNSFDAMSKIFVNEGVRGLQKGLVPAVFRESSKNFFRIVYVVETGNVRSNHGLSARFKERKSSGMEESDRWIFMWSDGCCLMQSVRVGQNKVPLVH